MVAPLLRKCKVRCLCCRGLVLPLRPPTDPLKLIKMVKHIEGRVPCSKLNPRTSALYGSSPFGNVGAPMGGGHGGTYAEGNGGGACADVA